MLSRFFRDPLFAFVVIGAAVFLADVVWQEGASDAVVVTQGDVDLLAELWSSRTGRPPSEVELDGLVDNHVTEEVMVREARRLGLDRSDPIIRRRLAQKLTFLVEDLASLEPPGEQELRTWFEARRDGYESRETVTFDHIYFRGDGGHEEAVAARGALEDDVEPENWRELGDPSLLARTYTAASSEGVCGDFGPEFCGALDELSPAATWQGPITSTYGSHLVRVIRKPPPGCQNTRPFANASLPTTSKSCGIKPARNCLMNCTNAIRCSCRDGVGEPCEFGGAAYPPPRKASSLFSVGGRPRQGPMQWFLGSLSEHPRLWPRSRPPSVAGCAGPWPRAEACVPAH